MAGSAPQISRFGTRRDALRRLLIEKSLDALLVTDERNVTYLTGFTGDSSYLLVTRQRELLLSDKRYTQQLEEECPSLELAIRGPGSKMADFTAEATGKLGLSSLGIEVDSLIVGSYERLREALKSSRLVLTSGIVEALREIKDEGEIAE